MVGNALTRRAALATDGLTEDWAAVLHAPYIQAALNNIAMAIDQALARGELIFPADPWRALRLTPLSAVKVVILGQDPYHGPDQAQGLAFSVDKHVKCPPSLRNIFQEIDRDPRLHESALRTQPSNDLSRWAHQGVLLLNTTLTVKAGQAASHARLGWQTITEQLIKAVAQSSQPVAFLLWGNHAQALSPMIELSATINPNPMIGPRLTLQCNHPSPLSARRGNTPFIGCGHFGDTNQWLASQGLAPIAWS
jgi:uracil-DNA glycosylase